METTSSSSFSSTSWIISSHHTIFHPSLGVCLSKVHTQPQHKWFGNHQGTCHGLWAQPLLNAKPVPCGLHQFTLRQPFPRNRFLIVCYCTSASLIPPQQEFPKLLNLCLFRNGKKIKHFRHLYFGEAELDESIPFFNQKGDAVWGFFF